MLQTGGIEDGNHLPVHRKTRPRDQGMTGQQRAQRLDDQVLDPLDRVDDPADEPTPCTHYHKLRPRTRGRATDPQSFASENHGDRLVAEPDGWYSDGSNSGKGTLLRVASVRARDRRLEGLG